MKGQTSNVASALGVPAPGSPRRGRRAGVPRGGPAPAWSLVSGRQELGIALEEQPVQRTPISLPCRAMVGPRDAAASVGPGRVHPFRWCRLRRIRCAESQGTVPLAYRGSTDTTATPAEQVARANFQPSQGRGEPDGTGSERVLSTVRGSRVL